MVPGQDNHAVVMSRTSTSRFDRVGWRAQQRSESLFIVRFEFLDDGEKDAFYFEVDIAAKHVQFIDDNQAMIKKYGLPAKPN